MTELAGLARVPDVRLVSLQKGEGLEQLANLPDGMAAGKSPAGKALKYVHRGSYDSLDGTYERITNQLDDKGLEAQDVFVESYLTDPRTTPDDKLVIEVYVPIK